MSDLQRQESAMRLRGLSSPLLRQVFQFLQNISAAGKKIQDSPLQESASSLRWINSHATSGAGVVEEHPGMSSEVELTGISTTGAEQLQECVFAGALRATGANFSVKIPPLVPKGDVASS